MRLTAGTRLGNYTIIAPVGAGGMGEVYRARDLRLGRDVALKVLPAGAARDPERLSRFEEEARAVAALSHPNVVVLHSIEDEGETRFLTMELVEGHGLEDLVVPGGLPLDRIVDLGVEVATALEAAHGKGVVHRDLKPANVMLTRDGRIKLLDFGLARLTQPDPGEAERTRLLDESDTAGRAIAGTVPYMAPEQVRGEEADPRADLYALGILLYELAAGHRPFQGPTAGVICNAILTADPPSLTGVRPDLPSGLERVIERCLRKSPEERFQSASELIRALHDMPRIEQDTVAFRVDPPVPATELLGRAGALEATAGRIRDGVRLLTVTGYGGTGKTRFAVEMFRTLAHEFPGGAAFHSLAAVTDPAEVVPSLAGAISIPEAHGRSAVDALVTVIGDRRTLLVLDNFEQVLPAAADLAVLLARCAGLQCVVTSRAPLKIAAEEEYGLPPLELPTGGTASPEELEHVPAVELFVQRAVRGKPGFRLTGDNAAAVVEICRRLDGLPLALELAAARIRVLEPTALLQRLDRALDLLTSGDRDLPLRQRTLRATISWSYSLLTVEEQALLRRLSVFHGGWTFEAMEEVCYGVEERFLALDEFTSLVEKGLVQVNASGGRYGLLETVRAFAAEQLHTTGEVERLRDAHADHFLSFAARIGADLRTPAQLDAMQRGLGDNANLHAATQWLISSARTGDAEALEKGLLLAGHLNWFWHISAQHFTAREFLVALLGHAEANPPSRGRALAWLSAGMVATTTGEWERSLEEWRRGQEDGDAVGDREAAAEGTMGVAYCHIGLGRMEEAGPVLEEAIARSAGVSEFMEAISTGLLGMQRFATGHLEEGIRLVEAARRIQIRIGDHEGGGVVQSFLAQMTFAQGDAPRALQLYEEALELLRAVGDYPEVARVHCEMGWTALAAGDPAGARGHFRRAVHANERVGSPRGTGLALLGMAAVEAAEGRSERAVTIAAAAEALSRRSGIVINHPMDPGVAERIATLKAAIPAADLDRLLAEAEQLTPAAVLTLIGE